MAITITFEPTEAADIASVRLILDALSKRDSAGDRAGKPVDASDLKAKVAADLWSRLGKEGRDLLAIVAKFPGTFHLLDLSERTGDSLSKTKSRWANLGRSIARTRSRFANIEIFKEELPVAGGPGYFLLSMDPGIRDAVRRHAS